MVKLIRLKLTPKNESLEQFSNGRKFLSLADFTPQQFAVFAHVVREDMPTAAYLTVGFYRTDTSKARIKAENVDAAFEFRSNYFCFDFVLHEPKLTRKGLRSKKIIGVNLLKLNLTTPRKL